MRITFLKKKQNKKQAGWYLENKIHVSMSEYFVNKIKFKEANNYLLLKLSVFNYVHNITFHVLLTFHFISLLDLPE